MPDTPPLTASRQASVGPVWIICHARPQHLPSYVRVDAVTAIGAALTDQDATVVVHHDAGQATEASRITLTDEANRQPVVASGALRMEATAEAQRIAAAIEAVLTPTALTGWQE